MVNMDNHFVSSSFQKDEEYIKWPQFVTKMVVNEERMIFRRTQQTYWSRCL